MEAIRVQKIVEKDGEVLVTGLPFKKGERVEMILLSETSVAPKRPALTARRLLESGLIGLWEDRQDIKDSASYTRILRKKAEQRDNL